MMLKTVELLSMVIPCFAAPTLYFIRVHFEGCIINHVDNMKQKSQKQIVRF